MRITQMLLVLAVFALPFMMACSAISSQCDTTLCCSDCPTESVLRVTAGDSLDTPTLQVRLLGVDAPTEGEPCFKEARDRLQQLAHTVIKVESGPEAQDIMARRLYYVYTDSGESIDEILITEGLVRASRREGQHRERLLDLERKAEAGGSGCLF